MKPADRTRLTSALRDHVARIALDLRKKLLAPGAKRNRALQLHADEKVGEDFDVWTDLLSRRAAVLWVLKSVYVRVLEDRGLLKPGRLLDPEAQQLFEKLAPRLGETAFLCWIYRDLASPQGGLPELFSPQPAEIALPADELSRALIGFWRHHDADSGAVWSFAEEKFEGELMGDLYQELDPVVKDRFALCQTPDFVRTFILDRTLTPAIENFGADEVRLLDPACGSGHFLIDGLKRLVAATAEKHKDWSREKAVVHSLDRVVGIDLNDYACALARTRLIMTAAELAGVTKLADAARFHPHVYWADGLEQVEKEEQKPQIQFSLFEKIEERPRAILTRSDVRTTLKKVFENRFHAVVANPPYIVERDEARKDYHREKIGNKQRYISAYRQYSLACPFIERCFQLAQNGGYVGLITSNNFMKREFGRPLVETVLTRFDLTLVVDTSQAYIPFHGTPTVLLFARHQRPVADVVRAVMGKRGEKMMPDDPAKGKVWSSIVEGWTHAGFENEYISVADLPRSTLSKHPWSLGGGGAADLRDHIEQQAEARLETIAQIGTGVVTREDDVYILGRSCALRMGIPELQIRPLVEGDAVRDWHIHEPLDAIWPYSPKTLAVLNNDESREVQRFLWPWRTRLRQRTAFGKTQLEHGRTWFEYSMFFVERFRTPLSIVFAVIATHNHFVLDRGGKTFKDVALMIKLPASAQEDDYLALLGLLNSSTASFWMKQVFQNKGIRGEGGGLTVTLWEQFFQHDSTKMKLFPVAKARAKTVPYAFKLDEIANARSVHSARSVIDGSSWRTGAELRRALDERHASDFADMKIMVALQEELDWLCYALYGLDTESDVVAPDKVEACLPTWLPWNLAFAKKDVQNREMRARGEESDEQPSVWWERHRWEPLTVLPKEMSATLKKRVEARRARTASTPKLALVETANFKRRWYKPDYAEQEHTALKEWLADHVEQTAKVRTQAFSLEQLVTSLQDDMRVLAVCEVLTGRKDFSLSQIVPDVVQSDAVPNHRFHVYKLTGLVKREVWERTWADQRREDAGEKVAPEVPPTYGAVDFLKPEYWRMRGKLDVPKERFIAFSEVPGRAGAETLYGWAGWTPQQRVRAILAIDEELEDASIPLADRIGLLDSAWRLLPDVAREEIATATRLKAELQALVGLSGPSRELLGDWKKRFPPPYRLGLKIQLHQVIPGNAKDSSANKKKIDENTMNNVIAPLRKVNIKNFRGIREIELELAPDVTVIFGSNAAGKTSVLDALAIGLGAIVACIPKSAKISFKTRGDIRVPWLNNPENQEEKGVEQPYSQIFITCENGIKWDAVKLRSAGDRSAISERIGQNSLHKIIEPLVSQAVSGGRDARWQWSMPLVAAYGTERAIVDVQLRKQDFRQDFGRLGAFDKSLHTKTQFKVVFEWFVAAEDEERREQKKRNNFDYRDPNLEWIRRAIGRAGLRCKNPRIETKPLRMVVDFEHPNGSSEPLDIVHLSDGYRTHFSLIVDIARRMTQLNPSDDLEAPNRGTNSEAIILIDEIDLHLDPTWQATVVKGLRSAFPNTQFVLTTHSEQVIGSVPANSVRKLVAGDGEVFVENVRFAEGATSERILIELMGTKERAGQSTGGENTLRLAEYTALVSRGNGETEAARKLRAELDKALPGDERLQQADLEMQKIDLLRKIKGDV
jgi:predicted ATP-binding protein involved in virulence